MSGTTAFGGVEYRSFVILGKLLLLPIVLNQKRPRDRMIG